MATLFERVLVTNDDGIEAPGLAVAVELAQAIARDVLVVAPERDQSGVGQSISVHHALHAIQHGSARYAINGTPADCVLYATDRFWRDTPPDLVLSGVNRGANLSDAIMYSGTVGAVLAAQHLGVPAIALSQAFHPRAAHDFEPALGLGVSVMQTLVDAGFDACDCWNVNFPCRPVADIDTLQVTRQMPGAIAGHRFVADESGHGHWLDLDYDHVRIDEPSADVSALRAGCVSAMPLRGSRCDDALAQQMSCAGTWSVVISGACRYGRGQ